MKIIKIPKDLDPQEIKDKIILLEKQLRQYIRILGLIIATIILETVLVLLSLVNIDYLSVGFVLFLSFKLSNNLCIAKLVTTLLIFFHVFQEIKSKNTKNQTDKKSKFTIENNTKTISKIIVAITNPNIRIYCRNCFSNSMILSFIS